MTTKEVAVAVGVRKYLANICIWIGQKCLVSRRCWISQSYWISRSWYTKSAVAFGFLLVCSLMVLLSTTLCSTLVGAVPPASPIFTTSTISAAQPTSQSGDTSAQSFSQSGGLGPQSGQLADTSSNTQSGGWVDKEQLSLPLVQQTQEKTAGNGWQKSALVVFGASIATLGAMALIYRWVR